MIKVIYTAIISNQSIKWVFEIITAILALTPIPFKMILIAGFCEPYHPVCVKIMVPIFRNPFTFYSIQLFPTKILINS